jgi:AcrR family transcriptional regulator/DNA-binding XRE family transcriptional regulator
VPRTSPAGADDRRALGARIRQARATRGLSQRHLADALAVSPATMSAVENGRNSITAARLGRIAEILGTSMESLLFGTRGPDGSPAAGADEGTAAAAALDWRTFEPLQLDAPLQAALDAFLEVGYHGATVRDIARRCGLSVPGVYHYYATKHDMLVALLTITMDDLSARTAAARAQGGSAVERFALLVECLALYHTHRSALGFVGASEMRSLQPEQRSGLAEARRRQQRMVDEEVEQARRAGWFGVRHPHAASRAVVTMCTALPQWFSPLGSLPAEEVARQYVEFALDLMLCDESVRPTPHSPAPRHSSARPRSTATPQSSLTPSLSRRGSRREPTGR